MSRFAFCLLLAGLHVSCSKDEAPSDPIQPSDAGAIDPNAAALPADLGGPVDPATAPGDIPGDIPGGDVPEDSAADDAVDAPLGTLTEDPWAAPGEPSDIKDGTGSVKGENLEGGTTADTGGIPSMGDGTEVPPPAASSSITDDQSTGPGYVPARKKTKKAPAVVANSSGKKKKKAKSKSGPKIAGKQSKNGESTRYVKAIQLNIRSAPDRKSTVVRRIKGGDKVTVTFEGPWAKLGEGEYIRTKYLSKSPQRAVTEAEIEAAWAKRSKKKAVKSKSKKSSRSTKQQDIAPEPDVTTDLPQSAPSDEVPEDAMHGDQDPQ